MKKALQIICLLILLLSTTLFAWDGFDYIIATESDNGILIEWQAKNEKDVLFYEIWRGRSDSKNLSFIGQRISPKGKNAIYNYLDDGFFSKTGVSGDFRFNYKVRAVLANGRFDDSKIVQASLSSMSVRRQTWGSIKAMFR